MRDARRIEERDTAGGQRFQAVGMAGVGLAVLGLAFGLGYVVGHRAGGVQLSEAGDSRLDPIAKLDAEREAHDKLTFYSQLTKEGRAALPPPPPALVPVVTPPVQATPPGVTEEQATARVHPAAPKPPDRARNSLAEAPHVMQALSAGPAKSGEYTVQVSSFQTHAEAKAFSASLERQGFRPFVVQASLPNKGTWYRVRLGRFDDESQAKVAKGLLGKSDIPGWVLRSD